ncbi:MAG: LacI family DNA-binding transcriptional regulator [Anaerolineales bacterium]
MTRVNIKDIAEKAQVSTTAVSFAFNNPARLSKSTVKRILNIADEMGYTPNPLARNLSTGKTGAIGLLVPQPIPEIIRNPFMPEFIEGIGEVTTHKGLSLMLVPPLKGSIERAIVNAAVDGFLTLGLEESKSTMVVLRQRGVPFVTVDSDPIVGVPAINVDDEGGAKAAMQAVLEAGHREIAILSIRSGKKGHHQEYVGTLRNRMNGYEAALGEFGLKLNGHKVRLLECVSTEKGGEDGFQRLWNSRYRPTAVVAMSDIIAIGAMKAARQTGLQVPNELSFVGFDDIPLAELFTPGLTTIAQPLRQKGSLAAELLVDTIAGHSALGGHHVLPTRLVVRQSLMASGNSTLSPRQP